MKKHKKRRILNFMEKHKRTTIILCKITRRMKGGEVFFECWERIKSYKIKRLSENKRGK